MNDVNDDYYSANQSPTTPVVSPVPKDSIARPCGDNMLKTMNPTPNGYNNIPNHKPKSDDQDMKHHDAGKHSEHHKNSSDHVKKKEGDMNIKVSSSHSTSSKDSSKDSTVKSDKEHHKEKKEHSSSHKDKDSSKSKDSKHESHKHHSSGEKKDKSKSDSIKKEHSSSGDKPKSDNFKENEKVKDGSSKESKHKDKEKHKDKHKDKDKSHKEKDKSHKDKDKSHKDKDKSHKDKESKHKDKESKHKEGEHKDKSEKAKGDSEIGKEKHKDKHGEKHKDKHSEKHKDKHSEKHKDKHDDKHKDKHDEKHKDKHGEKHKGDDKNKSCDKLSESIKEKSKGETKSGEKSETMKIKEGKLEEDGKQKHGEKHKKDKPDKIKTEPTSPKENGSSFKSTTIKSEPMSYDDFDMPQPELNKRKSIKREYKEDSEEEEEKPQPKKKVKAVKKRKADSDYEEENEDDFNAKKPAKKAKKTKAAKVKVKQEPAAASPKKKVKKEKEDEQEVWKWWEEEKLEDGVKWKTLSHKGPVFAPPYERVPKNVKFYYDGKHMPLSEATEEVAGFYGRMLDHEYTSKEVFNTNFFKDWKKVMTSEEKAVITDLTKCNFKDFDVYYKMKSEERKNMTKEQKLEIKKENERLTAEYGFCIIDGHKQKIGNFKIEPPGLFRGRGEHPKMGMLKRRVEAEDILINIGKEAEVPPPPPGHKWKEVRHDNKVSWLSSWTENILGSTKYIMLNPSSKLKGEKDWQKYETARKLKAHAHRIREEYTRDFKSKEMKVRQRAVALYFIDKLALRAGNEKDEDTADTVGCCSLRVEHITLDDEKDGQEYVVSFDFLGKDSIRYFNSVPVEKRAYKNLKLFMENKQPGDDLFDRLNTAILNKHLSELMEGLTAKVFRTYNASNTLQQQLDLLTKEDMSLPEKILAYNRANREVAILCNHQRAVPKGFSKSMENLKAKIDEKEAQIKECKSELKQAKKAAKESSKDQLLFDKKKKRLANLEDQLKRLEIQATDREENKQIALGTSKLNYLDPRISVAWCKKWGVPIEKIYNKTQRDKFLWAIEMAGADYKF